MIRTVEHYSARETLVPFSVSEQIEETLKPAGLWVSVPGEDDWPAFARARGWADDLAYRHTLEVDCRNVCTIETAEQFDRFSRDFALPVTNVWKPLITIDWPRVGRAFRGLIIAPHRWERRHRMGSAWYAAWDCASGCIWDKRLVQLVSTERYMVDGRPVG